MNTVVSFKLNLEDANLVVESLEERKESLQADAKGMDPETRPQRREASTKAMRLDNIIKHIKS